MELWECVSLGRHLVLFLVILFNRAHFATYTLFHTVISFTSKYNQNKSSHDRIEYKTVKAIKKTLCIVVICKSEWEVYDDYTSRGRQPGRLFDVRQLQCINANCLWENKGMEKSVAGLSCACSRMSARVNRNNYTKNSSAQTQRMGIHATKMMALLENAGATKN